jgi:hypothetical protein
MFDTRVVQRKPTLLNESWRFFLFCPPSRPEKPSTTYQKKPPVKTSSSQILTQGQRIPHLRMNCTDLTDDSCPGRISDRVLASSRTRFSNPSRHRVGTTTQYSPHQPQPDVSPHNGTTTFRSLTPFRGSTHPSTPPSLQDPAFGLPEGRILKSPFVFFLFLFNSRFIINNTFFVLL